VSGVVEEEGGWELGFHEFYNDLFVECDFLEDGE
jgi:hypothetical protein